MTDHMMVAHYDSVNGWSAPRIRPYGPLAIDPASSCIQYATNVFEGMKVHPLYPQRKHHSRCPLGIFSPRRKTPPVQAGHEHEAYGGVSRARRAASV